MMRRQATCFLPLLAAGLVILACGSDEEGGPHLPPGYVVPEPVVQELAPSSIALGEEMSILGSGFIDPKYGVTRVSFEGNYLTTSGTTLPVKVEVTPTTKNQGVLTWTFGPNIPFASVEETGSFLGVVKVRNIGLNNETRLGQKALTANVTVKPSILIRQMRPQSTGCSAGLTDTVEETKFLFEVKALGLQAGSQMAPLKVIYTFLKENFQFQGWLSGKLQMDPESLFPKKGLVSVVDLVTSGNISKMGTGSMQNTYVSQGGYASGGTIDTSADKLFGLQDLYTASVGNTEADYYNATMNIVAVDARGTEAKRTIRLKIWAPVEVQYDGGSKVVRSFDPVPVSGCIPGGDIGTDVSYTELTSESRSRSFTYSSSLAAELSIKVVKLSAEFGFDVSSSVSSTTAKDLKISAKILPKQFGVFYRQTLQLERRAKLTAHGSCGSTQDLGEVVVTDWTWAPDLAKGTQCPPLPPSNLGKGKTF